MNKCKGCQWYNKPYWSIINPCDNCPRESTNIEIFTRWVDPTIEEYKKEIDRLNNIIDELEKALKEENDCYDVVGVATRMLDTLKELKENKNE